MLIGSPSGELGPSVHLAQSSARRISPKAMPAPPPTLFLLIFGDGDSSPGASMCSVSGLPLSPPYSFCPGLVPTLLGSLDPFFLNKTRPCLHVTSLFGDLLQFDHEFGHLV